MVFVLVCFMCGVCFVKKPIEGKQREISDGRANRHIFYRKHHKTKQQQQTLVVFFCVIDHSNINLFFFMLPKRQQNKLKQLK